MLVKRLLPPIGVSLVVICLLTNGNSEQPPFSCSIYLNCTFSGNILVYSNLTTRHTNFVHERDLLQINYGQDIKTTEVRILASSHFTICASISVWPF